jgi:N-acetylmuramoyl-L-alanine amidase
MSFLRQRSWVVGRGVLFAAAWVGFGCVGMRAAVPANAWEKAVEARERFEAEPAGTHTRAEYARVMDGFRAIYHAEPGAAHAARAVEQVAELLAEQGRELGDKKSLHDAAGQYAFLAKAYPGGKQAEHALLTAVALLGPDAADDPVELKRVKAQLAATYPKAARELAVAGSAAPTSQRRDAWHPAVSTPDVSYPTHDDKAVMNGAPAVAVVRAESAKAAVPVLAEKIVGPAAVVTGIRHWSTASYTRVAIDLDVQGGNDAVRYEAARVENPDRIFFDLHHAKVSAQLAGKSFAVTDDGFLTRMRAAQFSDEVTRVVLDVHAVAEYSAFLLPNPTRLIIDIHGKTGSREQGVGSRDAAVASAPVAADAAPVEAAAVARPAMNDRVEVSSLPPMPVTDGSAGFGLPPKTETAKVVAQPRVVISSRPTAAKPVPNAVAKSSADNGSEVAAVSSQPGKVEATSHPTVRPVSSGTRDRGQGTSAAPAKAVNTSHVVGAPVEAAPPTADGETLVRALGLKIGRIVIDAGHGGHDSGTLGAGGIEEKDVVLDVALRLGKLLHDRLGAEIVYTRADDTFIPLETRTAIANKAQADLFISVHANSSQDASARGVEVYYLNFTSDPDAMRVAARENAVSTQSVHDLSDLVKKIALKDKIDESKELAGDVDASLFGGLTKGNAGLKDRGVKKAPFVVLIGANMPSILAEISFVTNPNDAEQLRRPEYRERVAESLYGGVARYASEINGAGAVKVASAKGKATERAAVR